MIKTRVTEVIEGAWERCKAQGLAAPDVTLNPFLEIPREEEHGDYSTNIAFILAPKLRKSPQEIARMLIAAMDFGQVCEKVEPAGKGFINFFVKDHIWQEALGQLASHGLGPFFPDVGKGRKVLIEFVSANPTGPLHIGHGRGAAVGDVLARLLRQAGYEVVTEYYVNDAGRQIRTLGESTYLRWRELKGESVEYPPTLYQGDYVRDFARLFEEQGNRVPSDPEEAIRVMSGFSAGHIMDGIVQDLEEFGVHFDSYYRESRLYGNGAVEETLSYLQEREWAYEKDGALWFATSRFEKDEDRVLVKSGGEKTYFASDIAYHRDKLERGFDTLIDIWGSDHHGYIPRLKASLQALGRDKESLKVILIQFVTLLKDGKPVGMSTRAGEFTTLREVLGEVGKDAARFFFLIRKSDAHLEFDLDLAKKTTNENPVYYVQYGHARIASIFRVAAEEGIDRKEIREAKASLLTTREELDMIKAILHFYDVIEGAARSLEPHRIAFYLLDLVGKFHSYYNKTRVLGNERDLVLARLSLLDVLQQVIRHGLSVLGVSAPEKM